MFINFFEIGMGKQGLPAINKFYASANLVKFSLLLCIAN